ncbi:MAG: type II secretion system protein GspG [Thermodesulfovibrionales bacterium]|nr:type II secretion system protein GspG [Nitrospinota bacterium]MCG2708958.1 type II secretion system protein GspG [Thermodesulfovibrionales bacterium]MCG2813611.1 type II secretion system protein GspG [Thermodesulfovibrionales bacterium]MDP3048473.1 type II secretion system protein GspG [Thermodesulfovibrionales bacterium]
MRKIFLKHFNEKGSGIVESMLVLIVISILVVVVMDRYETIIEEAKKVALKTELNNLRQAILFFKIKNSRYPESLKELITSNFVIPYKGDTIIKAKYLEHYSIDKEKNILDSFDLPFAYDRTTGRVWSVKKGFENW